MYISKRLIRIKFIVNLCRKEKSQPYSSALNVTTNYKENKDKKKIEIKIGR